MSSGSMGILIDNFLGEKVISSTHRSFPNCPLGITLLE